VLNAGQVLSIDVVKAVLVDLFFDSVHVDVSNSTVAIEDFGDLLKGGTLCLGVDKVDPD
jgi:hypothetical protein